MTLKSKPYPLVDSLIQTVADWIIHRRAIREIEDICASSSVEFSRIAGDLGVAPETLDEFVRKGPHAADELPRLLRELGIDLTKLAKAHPQLLVDMQRVCAFCGKKKICNRNLASHTSGENYKSYCENAETIDAIKDSKT